MTQFQDILRFFLSKHVSLRNHIIIFCETILCKRYQLIYTYNGKNFSPRYFCILWYMTNSQGWGDPASLAEATSAVKVASIWPSNWFGSGTYVNYIFISKIAILIWCTSPDLTLYRVPGLCQSVMHEINIFPLICKQVLFGLLFKPDLVTGKIVEIGSLRSNIHLVSLYIYIHFIVFCTLARINWSIIFL